MNFGAKNFFCLKNSKSNIPPPPWFSPKNASRVVIPTANGQTMQFQVSKPLFLSSAPWKTTKKTYISIIRQIWKNSPEKGCFLALNVPGGREPEFCQGLWQWFYIWYNCLHTLTEFQKKTMDGSNVMGQKVSFLAILGHFGAFLAIKEPLGTQRELFSKIRECYSFSHIKL